MKYFRSYLVASLTLAFPVVANTLPSVSDVQISADITEMQVIDENQYQLNVTLPNLGEGPISLSVTSQVIGVGLLTADFKDSCTYIQEGQCVGEKRPILHTLFEFEAELEVLCDSRSLIKMHKNSKEFTNLPINDTRAELTFKQGIVITDWHGCENLSVSVNGRNVENISDIQTELLFDKHTSNPKLDIEGIK